MISINSKSLLLGIGLGIVFSATVSLMFTNAIGFSKTMSKEQIIEKARKYGMTEESDSMFVYNTDNDEKKGSTSENQELTQQKTQDVNTPQTTQKELPKYVVLTVNQGDSSKEVGNRLEALGVAKSIDFCLRVDKLKLTTKIDVGTYKIAKGDSLDEIIEFITR